MRTDRVIPISVSTRVQMPNRVSVLGGGVLFALLAACAPDGEEAVPDTADAPIQPTSAPTTLEPPIFGELPAAQEEIFIANPPGIEVTPYVTGLEIVWALDFTPDGRMLLTERDGRIRVVSPEGELDPEPWATLENVERRLEDGLLGMTLWPDFENEPWVYVFYTVQKDSGPVNRVSRLREVDGRGTDEEVIFDDLPSARNHNGGRIRFGPDGMLYVPLGDVGQPLVSQDLSNPAGSILRITPDGQIPDDNPWPDSPIWAYGLRNVNGLAFRDSDGALFAADHGPNGEWTPDHPRVIGYDEINIIERGGNYGWPIVLAAPGLEEYEDPILTWTPAVPPGDLLFYDGDLMPELRGDLLFSTLRAEALLRIRFEDPDDPNLVTTVERWFRGALDEESVLGRLRSMAIGPDGAIYVGTTNLDGRTRVREGDDQVLRIAPEGQ